MTQVKAPIKLELKDGAVEVPYCVAELSALIQESLSYSDEDTAISLPQLTKDDWKLIHERLGLADAFSKDKTESSRQALQTSLKELSADELLSCMITADYLAMPAVFDAGLECAYAGHLNSLSFEKLSLLPPNDVYEIIFRRACAAYGPYEAPQITSFGEDITAMYVMFDGTIVSGSLDGTITTWDIEGNQRTRWKKHKNWVRAVRVTSDGTIVSGFYDGTVRILDREGNQLAVCEGHEAHITVLCIPSHGTIVSGSWDSTIRIWDLQGNQLAVCQGHKGPILALCVTPHGIIVSGAIDETVRMWDPEGNQLAVGEGHVGWVTAVCVTPQGTIVSGSNDGIVRIWDLEGNQLGVCRGHTFIYALCVTQNGCIVSGSEDGTVRVSDIQGNQLIVCREGHTAEVSTVCIAPHGTIVSGAHDGTINVWNAALQLTDVQAEKVWLYLQKESEHGMLYGIKRKLQKVCQRLLKESEWKQIRQLLKEDEELPNERY